MSSREIKITVFYCQHIPGSTEVDRQDIERRWAGSVKCYPLPCSGRFEQIHMLKSLQEFSDAVYLVTCPDGQCRYFDGNTRAEKRVAHTQRLLSEIGLEHERAGVLVTHNGSVTLTEHVEALKGRASLLGPSGVHPDRYTGSDG